MFSNITNFLNINKSDIKIPEFLQSRKIKDSDISILRDFFAENKITNFSEITIDMLNQYARFDYDKAIQVNTVLGLYGVEFIGKSSKKYSPNSRNTISLLISKKSLSLYETKLFQQNYKNLEIKFLEYFEKIGITLSEQITGINLSVLLDKLNILDLNINNIENDLNKDYFTVTKNNFEKFYTSALEENIIIEQNQSFKINNISIKNTDLTTRTVNILLANGIDTVGKLLQLNIDEFRSRRNVGYKTIDEILFYLNSKGYENILYQEALTNTEGTNEVNQPKKIDERIFNLEINSLNLPQRTLQSLYDKGIITIGDFTEKSYLLNSEMQNLIYSKIKKYGVNESSKYSPIHIVTPQNYFLKISEVFDDEWIINACNKYNLKNIGLLANCFPDIFVKDDSLIEQDIFFEKISYIENKLKDIDINNLPINLSYFEKEELSKKDISELIDTNYVKQLENIIINSLNSSSKTTNKKQEIIKKRFGINCDKKTLEEISLYYNCTKEAIRQHESRTIQKIINEISQYFQNINEEISTLLNYFGDIFVIKNEYITDIQSLMNRILKNIENRVFDIDFDNFCLLKKDFSFDKIKDEILDVFENMENYLESYQIKQVIDTVIAKYINNSTPEQKLNYSNIYNKLYTKLIKENFIKFDDNLYKFQSIQVGNSKQDRNDKIMYWAEILYPLGIHLPGKSNDKILNNLKPLYEKCAEIQEISPRFVANIIKENPNVIWWDRGTYIHVNNIKIDWKVVDFAIEEVIKNFDSGIHRLKPKCIYDRNKDKFLNANIPNETALVGLIRYKNNPRINTKRVELRDVQNANFHENMLNDFEQFVLKYPNGINKNDLMYEMCNKRGHQKYDIDFLCYRSSLIYRDNGIFYHKNNLRVNKSKLTEIINIIRKEICDDNSPFIHLRKIQNKYPATWVSVLNKNISPSFMGNLISSELIDEDFVIDNHVYVKKIENLDKDISMLNILYAFVEDKSLENRYVTISEIMNFCSKEELNDTKQPIVDIVSKFSFELDNEVYVHKNVIGYSDEFQEDIFELIQKLSEVDTETPIISYEDVISKYRDFLPTLSEGYDWNIYLLRSALSSDENLDIFDKTFIFKDNKFGVEDLDDTAAYLIMKNCENGYCKFKELDKLMAKYGVTPYKNLHLYKSRLFFEGSSIKSVDNDTAVAVEKFARDKYLNV